MGVAFTMHVRNTFYYLSEDLSASALRQASVRLLFDMVELFFRKSLWSLIKLKFYAQLFAVSV